MSGAGTIAVRRAEGGDRRRLSEIMNATWRETWAPHMPEGADKAWWENAIAEFFVDQVWASCLVAVTGGRVSGFVLMTSDGVTTLHVDPAVKRRGIGRALVEAAESQARSHGHGRLRIETEAFNTGTHAFYAALGFVETRRFIGDVVGYPTPCLELVKTF